MISKIIRGGSSPSAGAKDIIRIQFGEALPEDTCVVNMPNSSRDVFLNIKSVYQG